MAENAQEYLGDGVYAETDNGMILLYTMEGNRIYLEREVYESLHHFAARLGWKFAATE